jgi:hypothetical protein
MNSMIKSMQGRTATGALGASERACPTSAATARPGALGCRLRLVLVLLLALVLPPAAGTAAPAGPDIDSLPADVQAAIYGMIATLRGIDLEGLGIPATVDRQALAGILEPGVNYGGFGVHKIVLENFTLVDGDAASKRLLGSLILQDAGNRRAILNFLLYYRIEKNAVRITEGIARVRAPREPDVRFFVLRAEQVPDVIEGRYNHAQLYHLALNNDLLGQAAADPAGLGDYAVLAFVLDRLPRDDRSCWCRRLDPPSPAARGGRSISWASRWHSSRHVSP